MPIASEARPVGDCRPYPGAAGVSGRSYSGWASPTQTNFLSRGVKPTLLLILALRRLSRQVFVTEIETNSAEEIGYDPLGIAFDDYDQFGPARQAFGVLHRFQAIAVVQMNNPAYLNPAMMLKRSVAEVAVHDFVDLA